MIDLAPRAVIAAALCLLSGCVSEAGLSTVQSDPAGQQPRHARYDCGEDGAITLENSRSSVRLVEEASGEAFDLPASPPTQASRYGEEGYALVLEGREALWMKGNATPMTCRR